MLEGIGKTQVFADGEVIFRELSPGREVFVIESGTVRLERKSMREDEDVVTTVAVLQPGQFFGEMAVFDRGARSTSAVAQGPVTLRAIPRKALLARMREEPDIALGFLVEMSTRIRTMDSLVENILMRERLDDDLYDQLSALRGSARA